MNNVAKIIKNMFFLFVMVVTFYGSGLVVQADTPTGLRQTTGSKDTVSLEWNNVTDTTMKNICYGYEVATDQTFTNIIDSGTPDIFNYAVIDKLQSGSTYFVRVGYVNYSREWKEEGVNRHLSAPIEIVTAPDNFKSYKFVGANDTTATISYEGATGATGYEVTHNDQTTVTNETTYNVLLVDGALNKAHVVAYRESSNGYKAYNNAVDIYNLSKLTTTISKDNFGLSAAYTNTNVFYFGAKGYGNGFEIEGRPVKGKGTAISGNGKLDNVSSIRIDNLTKATMYCFRARAYVVTTDGQKVYGNWSDYRYFINPNGCKNTSKKGSIHLKWKKLKGVSKIKIQISTSEKGKYKTCKNLSGKSTSYTILKYGKKSLKKGKKYYIKMIYQTKEGISDIYTTSTVIVR